MSVSLGFLEARVKELTAQNEEMGFKLATIHEYAVELIFAIDEKQPSYSPKPNSEIVDMLHELLVVLDERNGGSK